MSIEDEITPPLGQLRQELGQIRREMRDEAEGKRRSIEWPEEQLELLKKSLGKPDAHIARELSKIGPMRTRKAVLSKRRDYERSKLPAQDRRYNGWPTVNGDIEQQSERFRVKLLEEMLKDVRRRRA